MSTIAKSFTATGVGTNLSVKHLDSFSYSVSGTFVGTVILERTLDGGQSFSTVTTATGSASGTVFVETPNRQDASYRFRCSAFTSGTIVTSIADAVSLVREIKDASGNTILAINEDGIVVTGTVTASGAVVAVGETQTGPFSVQGDAATTGFAVGATNIVQIGPSAGLGTGAAAYHPVNGSFVGKEGTNFSMVYGSAGDTDIGANVYRDGSQTLKAIRTITGYSYLEISKQTASTAAALSLKSNYQDAQTADAALVTTNEATVLSVSALGKVTIGPSGLLGAAASAYHQVNGSLIGQSAATNFMVGNAAQIDLTANIYRDGASARKAVATSTGTTSATVAKATAVTNIVFQVSANYQDAQTADSALVTTNEKNVLTVTAGGSVIVGSAAVATNAADGFLYVTSCAGTPTGTPTANTGRVALVYDSTNNKLAVYNGAWKQTIALV